MTGIYKVQSPTGKAYIGQSNDISNRFCVYRKLRCFDQRKLYNSLLKHGVESHSFSIIHELPNDVSIDVLNVYEQLYMDFYRDAGVELLNLKEGGKHGGHSKETRIKQSISAKGKQRSESHRLAISISKTGVKLKPHTKETIEKIRAANIIAAKNRNHSSYRTDEYRKKQSDSVKKIWQQRKSNNLN